MSNQVIFVPKQTVLTYKNRDGEELQIHLQNNRPYDIETKDGQHHLVTIGNVEAERTPNGKRFLKTQIEFCPGYMNVMKPSNQAIALEDVVGISAIDIVYERTKRVYKSDKDTPTTEGFTFAFDTNKTPSQYRITVYKGEFLSFAAKYNGATRTYYGHITNVDETSVTILRYMSTNGVRSLRKHVKIKIEDLLGIYRYALKTEDAKTAPDPEDGNASDGAGVSEEPANEAPENA